MHLSHQSQEFLAKVEDRILLIGILLLQFLSPAKVMGKQEAQ